MLDLCKKLFSLTLLSGLCSLTVMCGQNPSSSTTAESNDTQIATSGSQDRLFQNQTL